AAARLARQAIPDRELPRTAAARGFRRGPRNGAPRGAGRGRCLRRRTMQETGGRSRGRGRGERATEGDSPMLAITERSRQQPISRRVGGSGDAYETVRRAIAFISREWREQPSLEDIAGHVGMKPLALQRLFTRWAGLTPKGFLQA